LFVSLVAAVTGHDRRSTVDHNAAPLYVSGKVLQTVWVGEPGVAALAFKNRITGMTMAKPLAGIKIVEVAMWAFVPAAGAMLADLGADVIKIEPLSGDPLRGLQIGAVTTGDTRNIDYSWKATIAASAQSRSISSSRRGTRC